MLETNITYSDLLRYESSLSNLDTSFFSNGATKISEAKIVLESLIKNRGLKLRNLCKRLTLTDAVKSEEDEIERTRLVITINSNTGLYSFILSGTNDESSETWTTVTSFNDSSETWQNITALNSDGLNTITTQFADTYKYYKLTKTGTVTYSAYLIETSFELPLIYLALQMIFQELQALVNDNWEEKAKYYAMMFEATFKNVIYSYDEDENGEAETTTYNRATFRR
jgi:hypothetical protein